MVKKVHINFNIHKPVYLRHFQVFDIGKSSDYWSKKREKNKFKKLSKLSYKPMMSLLEEFVELFDFKFSLSFSGLFFESCEKFNSKLIKNVQDLSSLTNNVEIIGGTYFHTLSSLKDKSEFKKELKSHKNKINDLLGCNLVTFRNTNYLYHDDLSKIISDVGYENVLVLGDKKLLGDKSSEFIYSSNDENLNLFFSNLNLSKDINHKFSDKNWMEYPLTSDKFINWIKSLNGDILNLYLDMESFGFVHEKDSNIFQFFEEVISKISDSDEIEFVIPSKTESVPKEKLNVSCDDLFNLDENNLSEWLGNKMQQNAHDEIYNLKDLVLKTENDDLIKDWKKLQESTNFHFMNKRWADNEKLHRFLNPYNSPYDAFINFNNVLNDLILRSKELIED